MHVKVSSFICIHLPVTEVASCWNSVVNLDIFICNQAVKILLKHFLSTKISDKKINLSGDNWTWVLQSRNVTNRVPHFLKWYLLSLFMFVFFQAYMLPHSLLNIHLFLWLLLHFISYYSVLLLTKNISQVSLFILIAVC